MQAMQQHLGAIRSFASSVKANYPEVDEEALFRTMMEAFLRGVRTECTKLVGAEDATRLLDPFDNGHG